MVGVNQSSLDQLRPVIPERVVGPKNAVISCGRFPLVYAYSVFHGVTPKKLYKIPAIE
jgi:hypothetical protein